MPAGPVTNIPSVFMLMPSFWREKTDRTSSDQPRLPLLGAGPLDAEGLHRLHAGDVLDQVGGELGASSPWPRGSTAARPDGAPPRSRTAAG